MYIYKGMDNMDMEKIAVILETEADWGGEHQYALLVMECLIKYYEIVAICCSKFWVSWCRGKKIRYIKHGLDQFTLSKMNYWNKCPFGLKTYYSYFSEIGKYLCKKRVKILICMRQGTVIPPLRCKVIRPVHDLMHRYRGEFPEVKTTYESREILFKNVAKFSDVILTDSKLGKKQFIESYSDVMNKKIKVHPLPYVAPPHIWDLGEEYIGTPPRYIFYPAQFWQHKNHINLVKAVGLLKERLPDIKLLLVGSEKNSQNMVKRYIKNNNLDEQVIIYGFVSDGNINYLYRHAVMMIMPSYFGPTNIPPLEAMALGCPVAVSDNFAMWEQVGDAGLLFSPDSPQQIAECIYKVWTNEEFRQQMINKGYERIKKWNREKFEERLKEILKEEGGF